MSDPFVAEIRMVPFSFAPKGWAQCNGQLMPISQNTALFSLLGTYYGGNGTSNFALPNLQGNFPLCSGSGAGLTPRVVGDTGGEQNVTLIASQVPAHSHSASVSQANGNTNSPANALWAKAHFGKTPLNNYTADTVHNVKMNSGIIQPTGGNQPHNNLPPYLVLNFVIALQGIFPSR